MLIKLIISVAVVLLQTHDARCTEAGLVRLSLSKSVATTGGELGQPVVSFYTTVEVGTPPKPYRLMIDINGRENWIPHYLKLGALFPRLNYKNGYSKKSSTTSTKEADKEYTIVYDGCELTGKAYKDNLSFKDVVEAKNSSSTSDRQSIYQRFLAMSSASNDNFSRRGGDLDGVMSLNPWPISETGSDLMTVSMSRANMIKELKFAIALQDNQFGAKSESGSKNVGELSIGGLNSNYHLGALRFHKVWSQHSWELKMQSVMLGSASVSCGPSASGNECSALISTRHNDIYGPAKDVQQVLSLLGFEDELKSQGFKGDRLYEIDCLKVASSPAITFMIDGSYYMIPPTSYIRKKIEGLIFKTQTCYVAILANQESTDKQWILGTNFLSNFYSVFDINSRQIAFGLRK